jgi:hypothetical protein
MGLFINPSVTLLNSACKPPQTIWYLFEAIRKVFIPSWVGSHSIFYVGRSWACYISTGLQMKVEQSVEWELAEESQIYPSANFSITNPTWPDLRTEPGPQRWKAGEWHLISSRHVWTAKRRAFRDASADTAICERPFFSLVYLYLLNGIKNVSTLNFFVIPFYLQSVLLQSANCLKTYTVACRRVLDSASL